MIDDMSKHLMGLLINVVKTIPDPSSKDVLNLTAIIIRLLLYTDESRLQLGIKTTTDSLGNITDEIL